MLLKWRNPSWYRTFRGWVFSYWLVPRHPAYHNRRITLCGIELWF